MGENSAKILGAYCIGLTSLAAVGLIGGAIVQGYKDSGAIGTCSNASAPIYNTGSCDEADTFITGLTVFGTFAAVLAIAVIGKVIIGMFKGGM